MNPEDGRIPIFYTLDIKDYGCKQTGVVVVNEAILLFNSPRLDLRSILRVKVVIDSLFLQLRPCPSYRISKIPESS